MPKLVETPTIIEAAGTKPKIIEEFVGRVNTETAEVSVAKMTSPSAGSNRVKLRNSRRSPM